MPIYVQIVGQVKHGIEVGALRSGERLPTVRGLSTELTVAPTTVVKAYEELQRRGFVVSRAGVGTVVAAGVDEVLGEQRVEELFERLRGVVRDAAGLGIEEEELSGRFESEVERFYAGGMVEKVVDER